MPACVLSLDFELRWGLHDRLGLVMNRMRRDLENSREVVPRLLGMFSERSLRATWATVGAVACRDWTEYFGRAPAPPRYENPCLAVSPRFADLDPDGRLHFAPELVARIAGTPGQDLGTHTFSHIPMRERGIRSEDVAADLEAVSSLWRDRFGAPPTSLVFPRNQTAFLETIRAAGIRVWRGNPGPWYADCTDDERNLLLPRALRLLDDVNPWIHRAAPLEGDQTRSSLFLRLALPEPAWRLHVARIDRELARLRPGEVFHLWWHPHNVSSDPRRNLERVVEVLDDIAERVSRGTLRSRHMADLVPPLETTSRGERAIV